MLVPISYADVPAEITTAIFTLLDGKSLLSCTLVSRLWNGTIKGSAELQLKIELWAEDMVCDDAITPVSSAAKLQMLRERRRAWQTMEFTSKGSIMVEPLYTCLAYELAGVFAQQPEAREFRTISLSAMPPAAEEGGTTCDIGMTHHRFYDFTIDPTQDLLALLYEGPNGLDIPVAELPKSVSDCYFLSSRSYILARRFHAQVFEIYTFVGDRSNHRPTHIATLELPPTIALDRFIVSMTMHSGAVLANPLSGMPFSKSNESRIYMVLMRYTGEMWLRLFVHHRSLQKYVLDYEREGICTPVVVAWNDWGPHNTRMLPATEHPWLRHIHGERVALPCENPNLVEILDFGLPATHPRFFVDQTEADPAQCTAKLHLEPSLLEADDLHNGDVITSLPYRSALLDVGREHDFFLIVGWGTRRSERRPFDGQNGGIYVLNKFDPAKLWSDCSRPHSITVGKLAGYNEEVARHNKEIARILDERKKKLFVLGLRISSVTVKRAVLQTHYDNCRSLLAPVGRLPSDILLKIFESCRHSAAGDSDLCRLAQPLLAVAQVCNRWHGLVMGSPTFWSTIEIGSAMQEQAQSTRTNRLVNLGLERSGDAPLQIMVHGPAAIGLLAEHSKRWKTMRFTSVDIHHFSCVKGKLPLIENLHLFGRATPSMRVDFFNDAPDGLLFPCHLRKCSQVLRSRLGCTNAAWARSPVLSQRPCKQPSLTRLLPPDDPQTVLFDSAVVLHINVWAVVGRNARSAKDVDRATVDVQNCMEGRKVDVITAMLNIGKYTSMAPSLKRTRDAKEVSSSSSSELLLNSAEQRPIAGSRVISATRQIQALELSIQQTDHLFSLPIHTEELGRLPVYNSNIRLHTNLGVMRIADSINSPSRT
ncbi:hypothetical protein C8R43DRAFT_1159861 [Mycena crocata]|nr:hypothetical protein C8R43DRAFT_1159861 [Mycena crocata]